MPKKTSRSGKSGRSNKKIKKKKRDRFVINAVILSGAAVLLVIASNLLGKDAGHEVKLPVGNAQDTLTATNGEGYDVYNEADTLCRFDFIDVGQGDSALITTPNKEYILIDTGTSSAKNDLVGYLEESGVDEIDYLILSHPHNDHIGGAQKVLEEYKVNCVIMPNVVSNTAQFEKLYDAIALEKQEGCRVYPAKPGDRYEIDGCVMNMIWPAQINEDELNNCSASIVFSYGEFDALFTGDAEKKAEKQMIASGAKLDCELYKVAHHGSDTSNSDEFINAVSPEVSIISCGKNNSHGHPHTEIVQRLYDAGSEVYVTSELGTITVLTDGSGCSVHAAV